MKTIPLKLDDAIDHNNKLQKCKIIKGKLKKESLLVRDESMSVLKEFENIDHE